MRSANSDKGKPSFSAILSKPATILVVILWGLSAYPIA